MHALSSSANIYYSVHSKKEIAIISIITFTVLCAIIEWKEVDEDSKRKFNQNDNNNKQYYILLFSMKNRRKKKKTKKWREKKVKLHGEQMSFSVWYLVSDKLTSFLFFWGILFKQLRRMHKRFISFNRSVLQIESKSSRFHFKLISILLIRVDIKDTNLSFAILSGYFSFICFLLFSLICLPCSWYYSFKFIAQDLHLLMRKQP